MLLVFVLLVIIRIEMVIEDYNQNISLLIVDEISKKPLNQMLCFLNISSIQGSDYTIGPFLSDKKGHLNISAKLIKKELYQCLDSDPGSYKDSITKDFSIEIMPFDEMKKQIELLQQFNPDYAETLEDLLEKSNNHLTIHKGEKFTPQSRMTTLHL